MIALYIHWPYCLSKCPYCDFNSHVASSIDYDVFESAYLSEIESFADHLRGRIIPSIFFGGGTPSLMRPSLVAKIIDKIAQAGVINNDTEITLEANPTSSEAIKFQGFREAGVNRLSIGVQSLIASDLKALGREHNPQEALKAIEIGAKIFPRSSFDLIYSRSGQTLNSWKDELKAAMSIAPTHLSLYQLTIEKGTPFYKRHRDGDLILPENDAAADMYLWTYEYLSSFGYNRYEISNYAKPGDECRHNLVYWNYGEYLGIGPGAHSRLVMDGKVYARMNWHKPEKWREEVAMVSRGTQSREVLTKKELVEEILMMGLRLDKGINDKRLQELTGMKFADVLDVDALRVYINEGFAMFDDGILRLTGKGLLMHSYIVPRIIAYEECGNQHLKTCWQ